MERTAVKVWLWAYLGPFFCLLAGLVSLALCKYEALALLAVSAIGLPAIVIWGRRAFFGYSALLASSLCCPAFDWWDGGIALLGMGCGALAWLSLDAIAALLQASEERAQKGWDKAKALDRHLKGVQRDHVGRVAEREKEVIALHQALRAEKSRHRQLMNALRIQSYQHALDRRRLQSKKTLVLKDQLTQLQSRIYEKDKALNHAMHEQSEVEVRISELKRHFEEEILSVPVPDEENEPGELEELVTNLLGELKSRCVPEVHVYQGDALNGKHRD